LHKPIIIAGFGRSGTTWVSDIISKTLGGLILFEPDHPIVLGESKAYLYKNKYSVKEAFILQNYLKELMLKENPHKWLLRNHLPAEEKVSEDFMQMVWKNSNVLGFKAIRWNHNINFLAKFSPKLVFIIRHPLSVVSSLLGRVNFFKEFGWNSHWQLFKERNELDRIDLTQYDNADVSIKYVVLWTISNISALRQISKNGLPFFQYEKIYDSPYHETKRILKFLGHKNISIHPASIFYPSMSSLKTFHVLQNENRDEYKNSWQTTFLKDEASGLLDVVAEISSPFPRERALFEKMGYLQTDS